MTGRPSALPTPRKTTIDYNPTPKRYAIHPSARIHPSAEIGNPPCHRDWWAALDASDPETEGYGDHFGVIIEEGARIGQYACVDGGFKGTTRIGRNVWLFGLVYVHHDAVIGEGTIVCSMSSIAGHVQIGKNVRIDQGVTIKPFVKVGDGARLGMGAVVIRDVPAGAVVVGNPAKPIVRSSEQAEAAATAADAGGEAPT